ncbi:MAG: ATP-binding protein [Desulfobacterales bacterium]
MKIAVVGGGERCKRLMELFESHSFEEVHPQVIAVADLNPNAPGYLKAQRQDLFVTTDYNDFFKLGDVDLIIEMTGSMDIYNDILRKKAFDVQAIASRTAHLFWEIARVLSLQQRCSEKLEETRAMYRTVINELIQEDILVIGADYRILDVNDSLLAKLGLKRHEVIGRYCYEITHRRHQPCSGDQHPCPLIETLKTEKPSQTTHVHQDRDSREIFYSISTYPLVEGGKVTGAIEISRDITRDMNVQKVMMQQEKLASIGRLSAGVAHEINNPLTTILTTAMLLLEDIAPQDPMQQELETISSEALRCRKIVASLLDFARQKTPRKELQDLNKIIEETVMLINKQAAFKDIRLEKYLEEGIPRIQVDRDQVQQALINLAINAIEATGPGGRVAFSSRYIPKGRLVEIAVSDTGAGIEPEVLDKIIDPFFTTKEAGSGLGLSITHGILEQHGGTLDVMTEPGKGACFFLRFPVDHGGQDGR